jgi:flagellar basal-body rod protein FlgF/flagellar basal-body rod protein FlgG
MQNAALVGLSRQMVLANELDVVANNIANINTTGFKTDGTLFETYLNSSARQNDLPGGSRVNFVRDRGTWHNFSQGAVEATGNPLDVAIDGDAFLVVQTPQGERYTRNGALHVDATGQIVSADGMPILGDNGPIVLQPLDHDVTIANDGRITVKEGGNNATESIRGKLRLVSTPNLQQLQKDGAQTFAAPAGVQMQPAAGAKVTQGVLEKSNVNSVLEMSRMIEINRSYIQISQLLQQQSDTQKSAIQQLADVPN